MKQSQFKGSGGESIFWQHWPCENAIASVVIAHGLGEHGGRYQPLAHTLNQLGYHVFAIDHRGHGQSSGRRGDVYRFDDCITNLASLIANIVKPLGLPVILLGHSMGGAIATGYTLKHQNQLAGLILSGPALSTDLVPGPLKIVSRVLSKLLPFLPTLKVDPSLVSRDPEQVALYANDPLNLHSAVPIRTIHELSSAIDPLPAQFPSIVLPILILHGEDDALVPASASKLLYDTCRSDDKTYIPYPGLYHEILNELPDDRRKVSTDICNWLNARFSGATTE